MHPKTEDILDYIETSLAWPLPLEEAVEIASEIQEAIKEHIGLCLAEIIRQGPA